MYYVTQRHSVLFIYVVVVILESPLCFCNRLWVGDYAPYIYIPCTLAGDGLDQSVPYLAGKDSLNTQTDEVHVYAGRIFCSSIFST